MQTTVDATLPKRCRPSRLDNLAKRALTEHHDDLKEFLAGHELEVGVECKPMFSMLTNSVPIANIDMIVIIRGSP